MIVLIAFVSFFVVLLTVVITINYSKPKHVKGYKEYITMSDDFLEKCRKAHAMYLEIERMKPQLKVAHDAVLAEIKARALN